MNHPEIIKLQKFLQRTFNNKNIDVRPRAKLNDSVEVFVGEESIGLIHVDDEDGHKSYMFAMTTRQTHRHHSHSTAHRP